MSETSVGTAAALHRDIDPHQPAKVSEDTRRQRPPPKPRASARASQRRSPKPVAQEKPRRTWADLAKAYSIEYKTGVAASIGASVSAVAGYPRSLSVITLMQGFPWVFAPVVVC